MIIARIKDESVTRIKPTIFNVDGIEVHAYGILHGITGGSDSNYVSMINRAIESAPGAKYCEKSMKRMYKGLEYDMADWLVFRPIDTIKFAFDSFSRPAFWYHYFKTMLAEKQSWRRRFGENNIYSMCDLPSSVAFYGLNAYERREMRGLPNPEEYLKLNINRWEKGVTRRFRFADRDWAWLEYIEPNACIPLRSIHMLEYALAHAKKHGFSVISIFCGDIHSSDMDWYSSVRANKEHFSASYSCKIKSVIGKAQSSRTYRFRRTASYYFWLSFGSFAALSPYIALASILLSIQ